MYVTCIVIEFTEFIIRGLTLEAYNLELIDMGCRHTVCRIHWYNFLWSKFDRRTCGPYFSNILEWKIIHFPDPFP